MTATDHNKAHLHNHLRWVRQALVWKLDGLGQYEIRKPLTPTGTNLLGLVKHVAIWDSRYLGEVFGRPFPEHLPAWDDPTAAGTDHWAAEHESKADIVGLYHRVWAHSDATIDALGLDASGYVPWWQEQTQLFNVMVHCLSETTRHAGHADILRELLDGSVGVGPDASPGHGRDGAFWEQRYATIERAASKHQAG